MTRTLNVRRRPAASGTTDAVVVFLHGYGADGADLLALADPMAPHLPNAAFVAPDAPEPCIANPMGYQWFPIPWLDGSSEASAADSMARSARDLDAFLDGVLESEGVSADRLVPIGFSQGTMMALHVVPRRPDPVAGIVGFSGRLLGPELLAAEAVSRPPVLLAHGDRDDVVPFASMAEAEAALDAAGFDVGSYVMQGTAHGIAPDGLGVALGFVRAQLGL